MMVNAGASLPIVGKILGHSQPATTARYAHLERNPAREAAETAAKIAEAMKRPAKSGVLQFNPKTEGVK
jgi:integrase